MPHVFRLSRYLLFQSKTAFEPHMGEKSLLRGLVERKVFSGELIVSHHNNSKSKVITENNERFGCNGFVHRNRALSGDQVYVMQTESVEDSSTCGESDPDDSSSKLAEVLNAVESMKAVKVVAIKKRSGQRYVVRSRPNDDIVQPRDPRFPAMRLKSDGGKENVLSLVSLKEWEESAQYPTCELIRVLGREGDFDAEDEACLEMHGLRSDAYSSEIRNELKRRFPSAETVVAREVANRPDRRTERVFSIDPPSARDLDDAISITQLGDETFKIGVHVADVSYFVENGSRVDSEAKLRATSVYLPRKVFPMLPAYLSEDLCSLLPDEDRLAFSVYFTLNGAAELVGAPEIKRTIVRSRARLNYDEVDALRVKNVEIRKDIEILMKLAEKLRKQRIANGSISIDDRNKAELEFDFHDNSFPMQIVVDRIPDVRRTHDSHMMIEELMVLTNKIIADKLCDQTTANDDAKAERGVVRRHRESEATVKKAALAFLNQAGVKVPKSLSLTDILVEAKSSLDSNMFSAFTHSILADFNRAEYVVTNSEDSLTHWGVGAQRYMHFTSPIRRYADLIVHRKLCRILNLDPKSDEMKEDDEEIALQLRQCNINSRSAQESEKQNKLFYFSTFVRSFGNHGFRINAIVQELIAPNEPKGIKGSVCFFIPILADEKSQSLESLGLEVEQLVLGKDKKVESIKAKDKRTGTSIVFKLLSAVSVRAFVKPNATYNPKYHLRLDHPVPSPPPL